MLGGLKLAFVTSVVGMSWGIILRMFTKLYTTSVATEESSIESLCTIMAESQLLQKKFYDDSLKNQIALRRSIVSNGNAPIDALLKQNNSYIENGMSLIIRELQSFRENLAKNNSEAFIKALTHVIKDFNEKLTEQFGQNFKQLNEAVGRMLNWQKNYSTQVEQMVQQFQESLKAITITKNIVQEMVEKSSVFQQTAVDLTALLQSLNHEREQLEAHLAAFSKLSESAQNAFPIIEENLQNLTHEAFNSAKQVTAENKNMVAQHRQEIQKMAEINQENLEKQQSILKSSSERVEANLKKIIESLNNQLESLMQDNMQHLKIQTDKAFDSVNEVTDENKKMLTQHREEIQTMAEINQNNLESQQNILKDTAERLDADLMEMIESLKAKIENLLQDSMDNLDEIANESFESAKQVTSENKTMLAQHRKEIQTMGDINRKNLENQQNILKNTQERVDAELRKMMEALNKQIEKLMQGNAETIARQISVLDEQLENQLKKSLNSMGAQLISITRKFVDDYSELTEKMQEVVAKAEDID